MPPCFPLQRKVNTLGLYLQYHPAFFYLCFLSTPIRSFVYNLSCKVCLSLFLTTAPIFIASNFYYIRFLLHPIFITSDFYCIRFLLHPIFIILIFITSDFYYIRFLLHPIFITTGVLPRRGCFSLTPRWLRREATGSLRGGETGAAQLGRRPCRSPYNIVISGSTETWSPTKLCCTRLSPTKDGTSCRCYRPSWG